MGEDVLYSGTVSVAMEAVTLGIPGIAFSFASRELDLLPSYCELLAGLVRRIVACRGISPRTRSSTSTSRQSRPREVRGVRVTKLGSRFFSEGLTRMKDPWGKEVFWIGGGEITWTGDEKSDHQAVKEGYISITPLHMDLTSYDFFETVRGWALEGGRARRRQVQPHPACRRDRQADGRAARDLRARGLLDSTMVIMHSEFGRMPISQRGVGRDHNPGTQTVLMAGRGVNGGQVSGPATISATRRSSSRCPYHDLHATMLHLLGVDHKKLTYRFNGRDMRLTDVYGDADPANRQHLTPAGRIFSSAARRSCPPGSSSSPVSPQPARRKAAPYWA